MKKYAALFLISFKDRMASPMDVLARSVFFALIIFIFSRLWANLGHGGIFDSTSSLNAQSLVWYLFITEAIVISLPSLTEQVDREIQTGDIAYQLVRPLEYLGLRAMNYLGDVFARFLVNVVIGALTAGALVGFGEPLKFLAYGIPLFVGAFLIHLGISLSISMLGFWVEDTLPFFWFYSKASFILGGLLMPIDFYPGWLQKLSHFSPLRDGVYSVAKLAIEPGGHALYFSLLFRQALWVVSGLGIASLLFERGLKRLEARGG